MSRLLRTALALAACAAVLLALPQRAAADVFNLRIVTDNGPDYTDLDSFVRSITAHCPTPAEKCIAVWRWGRRSRRQTSCATEDGRLIWDPILHYNSYGAMNCGVISALNVTCFLKLGYRARYVQLGDHTVSEVSWDDGRTWHLFDSSMSFFCYNHAGQVASCQEIQESHACELSGGKSEPGHYYLYHGAPQCRTHLGPDGWRCAGDNPVAYERTLLNGASSYTDGFSVDQYTLHARYGHRFTLNLRPDDFFMRFWQPMDAMSRSFGPDFVPNLYRPVNGGDPDEQHDLQNLRGNGMWLYQPDFTDQDCLKHAHSSSGMEVRRAGSPGPCLRPAQAQTPGIVIFKIAAANVITGMSIGAEGWKTNPRDEWKISVSRCGGIQWTPVWQSNETGLHGPMEPNIIVLRDEVAGVTECLVKMEMTADHRNTDVGLYKLMIATFTQLNRRTLPKLTLGTNRVRVSAGPQVNSTVLWPPLHDGLYRRTVFDARDVHSDSQPDGMYKATLGAAVNDKECYAVWRMEAPTDITSVDYGCVVTNRSQQSYVSLQYSFDGENFTEFFRKSDGDAPFDKQVVYTLSGPQVPAGARQAFFKTVFFCKRNAATYNMPGIQDVLIRLNHNACDPRFQPIVVVYEWREHRESGEVKRGHTEVVKSLPHEYTINVAGVRDPTMVMMIMRVPRGNPRRSRREGYSDGVDVASTCEPKTVNYRWGNDLARDKPYTAGRPSSQSSGNPDEGRELTNGVVIAPTDYVTHGSVQPATAFWEAGDPVAFVVDLGSSQPCGGVRVSTHQPNERYGHPQRVEVAVSPDGQAWEAAGTIRHNDLWQPPGDYEPWEHDDSRQFAELPAGGRLAYSYPLAFAHPLTGRFVRFTFTPLPGTGLGISELAVFDEVQVDPAPPPVAPFEKAE